MASTLKSPRGGRPRKATSIPGELLLTIPGSEESRGQELLPIPPHLFGKSRTYIGELRQKSTGEPILTIIPPVCPRDATTQIIVGPKDGFTHKFTFNRKLLMEHSEFFAAIYGEGGKLYKTDQVFRCYDIPVKAMAVIQRVII